MVFEEVLKYTILVVFGLTAALAVLSIPDWIKISEWYKKKLFLALIIEIVVAVISYFAFLTYDKKAVGSASLADTNIVDSTRLLTPYVDSQKQFINLKSENNTVGRFAVLSLDGTGLFNTIDQAVAESSDYALVKWEKQASGWTKQGNYLKGCPYYLKVTDSARGTIYQIQENDNSEPVYCSTESSKSDVFAVDNRVIHFVEDKMNNVYYLFRITEANLNPISRLPFVHVLQIKIKPVLVANKE
ncbi:hypothetical protein [Dysgonomonas sp. 511]|uniref:hypothetical protein n=1 Tax=Dysgonomonas sp. 511 TaxID=2302930 RepID=UPI0013D08BCE|nr:hypothetical protein [Dysgonomonas sp. 511]NDV77521.1 hypothetical protein [Dysgonomonas sp. 511]